MQRIYRKRVIAIVLLGISVIAAAAFMQMTVANSDNADYRNLKCFYMEEPDSLDVVVLGASEIVNGYSAAEAYRTEGFTSYPFAISVNSVLLWKYELKEIEKRQTQEVLSPLDREYNYDINFYKRHNMYSNATLNSLG